MHILVSIPTIIILAVLALLSFFFSASEASLIALSKLRAKHLVNQGVKGSQTVFRLITKLDRVIAAILIGNNFVNILMSSLATVIAVGIFGANWGVLIATFSVTLFVLIFCEISPKTLAIRYSEKTALVTAPFLEAFVNAFSTFITLFIGITNLFLKAFGIKPEKRSPLISEEELKLMIEIGKDEGVLSDEERKMLHRIFEFGDTKVNSVMIPREKMVAISKSANSEALLDLLVEEGHARIPVYEGSPDTIIGIIYARDLLYLWRNKALVVVEDLIHPAYYVAASKRVNELLREFQSKRLQIAIVRDEHNKALGLVTLEDLFEEIVGEIEEETIDRQG